MVYILNNINFVKTNKMKQTFAFLFMLLTIFGCANSQTENTDSFIKDVDAKTFKNLAESEKGIVLDVRTPEETAEGIIPNATIINLFDADFEARIKELPKDKEIYVYCRSGKRSAQAAEILQKNGFDKIYNLSGGFMAWEESGYEISKP